jgi:hypothetical protein
MPVEGRQRAAALDRGWSIYLSLTSVFILPEDFHVEFPIVAESVLITGALQVTVAIRSDLSLSLREEYGFDPRQRLTVSRYSYNLLMSRATTCFARIICLFIEPITAGVYCPIRLTIFTTKRTASIRLAASWVNL